jgi:hypothetical protein
MTTLANCVVTGNAATNAGGGLYNKGQTTLTNCTIAGNTATGGGGLANAVGTATLSNCTIVGNTATGGGGLDNLSGTATLSNTIVGAQTDGVDILVGAGNVTGNYSLIGDGSGIKGGTGNLLGSSSSPINPRLAALGDYGGPTQTMALLPGSPAIGGGTATGAPATDQRGVPRTGHVDIGAFQSEGFTLTPATGSSPQSTGIGQAFANPLAVTVTAVNPAEPVDGGVIFFKAPDTGASATLSAASATITNGQAGVSATAGTTAGPYAVTASAGVGLRAAGFALSNRPGTAASVAVVSGSGQTAAAATGFAAPLVVVVKDAFGNPVPGVSVAFAAPAAGASAALNGSPAVTGADGRAVVTATANATLGSYTVMARAAGASTTAEFALTNTTGLQNLVVQPVAALAGQAFINVVLATFTDSVPGASPSDFRAGITWGDGITTASTTVIADGPGRFAVLGTHTYVDAGVYTFGVQVTASSGAAATGTGTATVTAPAETRGLGVTTYRDVVDTFDDLTSLREAIAYANSHPGPDTITFDPSFFGKARRTIVLTGGPLVLTDPATTTIKGPGAKWLTISGGGRSGVFDIRGGSLALSGITITGGSADVGGGVCNRAGDLALSNVAIRGNQAFVGGGLFNTGHIAMSGVTIKSNRALIGRNVFNTSRATLHWQRAQAAHQAKARVSIPLQERTSWVASK